MRLVVLMANAALICLWGAALLRTVSRRLRELAARQRELLLRLHALHRATVLGMASIRAALREATREAARGLPPGGGDGVSTVAVAGGPRRAGDGCREHDALRLWTAARPRRAPERQKARGGRRRPRRLRP